MIGIYIGWRGDWRWFGTRHRLRTFLSFWDRYRTAQRIGRSPHLKDAVRRIITAVKTPLTMPSDGLDGRRGQVGQLVVAGHSMGALIVEETLHTLLADGLSVPGSPSESPLFPDLVLALNSAADSRIFAGILVTMHALGLAKQKAGGPVSYSPPMLISATSVCDLARRCCGG